MNDFVTEVLCTAILLAVASDKSDAAVQDGRPAPQAEASVLLVGPTRATGLDAYTLREVKRVFGEQLDARVLVQESTLAEAPEQNMVVIGTAQNNPLIARLLKDGFLEAETQQQGYSMRCGPHPKNPRIWLLAIAGADSRGALYGLRDMEHYETKNFSATDGNVEARAFSRRDYPRIEHRGHWVWGCNMPDKKAWLENMSRWKLNELIHWDNYPPKKAKEYVDFAHERGIRVVWGFGWGWNPDWNFTIPAAFDHGVGKGVQMCGSSEFNRAFFKREILQKVRTLYVPSGCDGIYFQAFTEVPKCQCDLCRKKTKGEIMLEFVNPIVDAIKKEFPDLWISCGIHANLGTYDELKDLDPRVNIYWENCPSGTSIRGEHEDFGYINKTLPYGHGFSQTCLADPDYTEASLREWMDSNAQRYSLKGDINKYHEYMQRLQEWGRGMLGKPSTNKHATTVADHSVFCRRTPYMHVALAEAMWNPNLDTEATVDSIVEFLNADGSLPGFIGADARKQREMATIVQHDAVGKELTLATRYHPKYTGGGTQALTDGRRAVEPNAADSAWQGYEKQNLDAMVDLGKAMGINSFSTGFLHQPSAGVHLPKQVEYAVSQDGKAFQVVGIVDGDSLTNANEDQRQAYRLDGLDLYDVRYIRIRAKYVEHWLFVDEIMINPLEFD